MCLSCRDAARAGCVTVSVRRFGRPMSHGKSMERMVPISTDSVRRADREVGGN